MTIRETISNVVERRAEQVFLVDANTGREITYGEFHRQACAVAAELRKRGLRKGDRVGVILPNSCELAVLYFACIYLGSVIVPVNPALSKGEMRFIVESCKPCVDRGRLVECGASARVPCECAGAANWTGRES